MTCSLCILMVSDVSPASIVGGGERALWEQASRLAPSVRAGGFRLKSALRDIAAPLLPPEELGRFKWGFSVPLTHWFQGPLMILAQDLLGPERIRAGGILDPRPVGPLLEAHLDGRRTYYDQLIALIMFRLWQAAYLDGWPARRRQIMAEAHP